MSSEALLPKPEKLSSRINKLLMKLIIKAAKNENEEVIRIAKQLVELFEKSIDEGE